MTCLPAASTCSFLSLHAHFSTSLCFALHPPQVGPFFASIGFPVPERKSEPDFLQEVTSRKDQAQYWRGGAGGRVGGQS